MGKIKRVIFDFDNTLMPWKDEYLIALEDTIKKYKLCADVVELDAALNSCKGTISIKQMINYAKMKCGVEMNEEMINHWLEGIGKVAVYLSSGAIDTLDYLKKKKYSLVVLSNFITYAQEERAKSAGIRHYFEEFYGAEKVLHMKPHESSFISSLGLYQKEECVMVGDDLDEDIKGVLNCGIQAIYFDYKDRIPDNETRSFQVIKKFADLKNIL